MRACLFIVAFTFGLSFMAIGQNDTNYRKTQVIQASKLQDLDTLHLNFCDTFSIEINGLYPIQIDLPPAASDNSKVKILLQRSGFKQVDWGGGNWDKGPRIMTSQYKKGTCNCEVSKVYYYNKKMKDGNYNMRVSERLSCNAKFNWDE